MTLERRARLHDAAEALYGYLPEMALQAEGSRGGEETFFALPQTGFGKALYFNVMAMQGAFPLTDLALEARGLTIRRGFRLLFEGLDVDLARSEILQLSGPNGAGKSTLMRALAGFTAPDAGEVRWRGVSDEIEPATVLHYHGHREGLREALSPRENLAFSATVLGGDVALIESALARLGASRLIDLPVQVLSAGQRRRVALARLLVAPRPVWLLDEPLAALDVAGQALVSELLAEHAAQGGMALVATHQPLSVDVRHMVLGAGG